MKVIKWGTLQTYLVACQKCGTIIEFEAKEAQPHPKSVGRFLGVKCPLCNNFVFGKEKKCS